MKKTAKILSALLIFLMSAILVCGCAKGKNASENTIYIDKKGKVTDAIVEKWDKEIYDDSELEKQIKDEIKQFEAANKDSFVKLEKFEIEEKQAKVNLKYDSLNSYEKFNNVTAFCGTIKEAQKEGYDFSGEFKSTGKKPAITINEINESEEYAVYIISEHTKIVTQRKILYASSNVKISNNKKSASFTGEADDKDYIYLIYKK